MVVRTNAFMRLPANELGQAIPSPGPPSAASPPTSDFAEITSEEYSIKTNSAIFTGGVRIIHPRMDWACGMMTVLSNPAGEKDTKMTAERTVDFHFIDDQGNRVHGTCEKTVYTYRVLAGVTNDMAIMTGNPVLETADGSVLTNSIIILDHANNKIRAPGKYRLYGKVSNTSTNTQQLLKKATTPPKR
jgi:lipopolysaccharide export system protein LptA